MPPPIIQPHRTTAELWKLYEDGFIHGPQNSTVSFKGIISIVNDIEDGIRIIEAQDDYWMGKHVEIWLHGDLANQLFQKGQQIRVINAVMDEHVDNYNIFEMVMHLSVTDYNFLRVSDAMDVLPACTLRYALYRVDDGPVELIIVRKGDKEIAFDCNQAQLESAVKRCITFETSVLHMDPEISGKMFDIGIYNNKALSITEHLGLREWTAN